jgi:hypothetical protein
MNGLLLEGYFIFLNGTNTGFWVEEHDGIICIRDANDGYGLKGTSDEVELAETFKEGIEHTLGTTPKGLLQLFAFISNFLQS